MAASRSSGPSGGNTSPMISSAAWKLACPPFLDQSNWAAMAKSNGVAVDAGGAPGGMPRAAFLATVRLSESNPSRWSSASRWAGAAPDPVPLRPRSASNPYAAITRDTARGSSSVLPMVTPFPERPVGCVPSADRVMSVQQRCGTRWPPPGVPGYASPGSPASPLSGACSSACSNSHSTLISKNCSANPWRASPNSVHS